MAFVLAIVQVLVLSVIVTILHMKIGAGLIVCAALLIAGGFLALGELRTLNYMTVRHDRPRVSRPSRSPRG